jgi:hypothetical protein
MTNVTSLFKQTYSNSKDSLRLLLCHDLKR